MVTVRRMGLAEAHEEISCFGLTLFHSYAWLKSIEEHLGLHPEIALFADKGRTVGFIPLFPRRKGITINFSPSPGTETAYGGIACKGSPDGLYAALKSEVRDFFVVHPAKVIVPGLICEPKFTIITKLDANNAEDHLPRLKKGHRYNIRKAQKDAILDIREGYDEKALKDYYALLEKTYAYKRFSPLPFPFYKGIISHFHKENNCRLLVAYADKRPVGTICALIHDNVLYYWTGGFLRNPDVSKLYPNDVMQWKIIEWGYERKIPVYDMLGGDLEGIREFKLGFGGELVEYTRIFSSKRLHLLSKAYATLGQGMKNILRK